MDRGEYARVVRARWLATPGRPIRQAPGLSGDRIIVPRDRIAPVLFDRRAPETPCRVLTDAQTPSYALRLVRRARRASWDALVTGARGWTLDSARSPSRLVDSVVVRLRSGTRYAVAAWWDGTVQCRYVFGSFPLKAISDAELTAILAGGE